MDLFSLLAERNMDLIFDQIFSHARPLSLVQLSKTSLGLKKIVEKNRIAEDKIKRWRRMIMTPPRMKTFSDSSSDNTMVPCVMVKDNIAMFVELSNNTSINIFNIDQEAVTDRIVVEQNFPLPVYDIDFNEDFIVTVEADNEEMWNNLDRKRIVRLYSRQSKVRLSFFRPPYIVRKVILDGQFLYTMSAQGVVLSNLKNPLRPLVKPILVDCLQSVVDITFREGTLLILQHFRLSIHAMKPDTSRLVWVKQINLKEKCHKVALSWPLAAIASDEKIEILNIKNGRALRELSFPYFLDSLDIRYGCLLASEEGQLRLWSLEDILDGHEDRENATHQNIHITDSFAGAMMVTSSKIFAVGWNCKKVLMEFEE